MVDNENNGEEKANLEVEKQIYLRKAEVFYSYLKQLSAEAKQNDSIIDVLRFHFQQNMPLPHIPSVDFFYKRQLWSYNFVYTQQVQANLIFICTTNHQLKKDRMK